MFDFRPKAKEVNIKIKQFLCEVLLKIRKAIMIGIKGSISPIPISFSIIFKYSILRGQAY